MDRDYVIQNDVVERYLRGQLSAEDSIAFEEHCFWCRESLDDLELAEKLREGFQAQGDATGATRAAGWPRFLRSPQYAAAASVLLAVSLATSGVLYSRLASEAPEGFASAEVYTLEMRRGSSESAQSRIGIGDPDTQVVLIVYPDATAAESYRVTLLRGTETGPVWQGVVKRPAGDALAVSLPAALLSPGNYLLRIEDTSAPAERGPSSEIPFVTFVAGK